MNEAEMAYPGEYNDQQHFGMTKREVFLKDVLAGLCANVGMGVTELNGEGGITVGGLVQQANAIVDEVFRG